MRTNPAVSCLILALACAPDAVAAPGSATLTIGGSTIEVEIAPGRLALSRAELIAWVTSSANAVVAYFDRFPVARYRLVIEPAAGRGGVVTGTTWAYGGAHSRVIVGEHADVDDLKHDWVLTHEMIHTAFPDQPPAHRWIEEGTATYIEPLARSWVGDYPADKFWIDAIERMPQGLPARGDRGLDRTHTWGRTYWGGAVFCLLADVEIRSRTNGARGLVDALRGIVAAGGNSQADWSLERALREGDKATGVPVLQELYRRMKDVPVDPDLPALWRALGVRVEGGKLVRDDQAPKAAIRRAISAKPARTR
jgi:hypothetical protein